MPPRSKALAAIVKAMSSTALWRSSRRSISTSQPIPSTTAPVPSPSAASTAALSSPAKAKRSRVKAGHVTEQVDAAVTMSTPRGKAKRVNVKTEDTASPVKKEEEDALSEANPAATKKRRTKKEIEEEDEIFPPRPSPHQSLADGHRDHKDRRGSGIFIGAHTSSAGGVENAALNALRIGGNAFSCFVRPKMQWASNPIPDKSVQSFKQRVIEHNYMPILTTINCSPSQNEYGYVLPHGCFLVNLANPDESKREKSFEAFLDDLQRCEQLGIRLFNFHPGSMTAASATGDEPPPSLSPAKETRAAKAEACALVASYINRAHSLTSSVIILIENMAGSKNDTILGSSLHDLASMISHVKDKSRVGVCIDTCHAFAAGYDLRTPETYRSFADLIDTTIGWEAVKAFHLNDSKFGVGCKKDRHENIGRGHVGLGGFWCIVNDERWNGIPLILETPTLGNAMGAFSAKEGMKKMHQVWSYQIQALYALRGTEWGQWKEAEEWLAKADVTVAEAERLHAAKKGSKPTGPGKKKKKQANEDEEESDLSSDE